MKSRYKCLLEQSIDTMLSAVELYNKPDFKNREQIFTILVVASWESLLKAKILKENNNRMVSLYVKVGSRYKKNRSGGKLTIGIEKAMTIIQIPERVKENINAMVSIRDAAIHLTARSSSLPYLVFTLGSATLQNYAKLAKSWFGASFNQYNFYILPLGFSYPFRKLSAVDLKKEPEDIATIVRMVEESQKAAKGGKDDFFLVCEIQTTFVSAKKITEKTDLVTKIDPLSDNAIFVPRLVNLHDQYPLSYREVYEAVKNKKPSLLPSTFNNFIKEKHIKGDERYSTYHYRRKEQEQKGPTKSTAVTYNQDFLELVLTEL